MKPFQLALACLLAAAVIDACTPLPDIEDDEPIVNSFSPIPLDQIDAAICDADGAPESLCNRLR